MAIPVFIVSLTSESGAEASAGALNAPTFESEYGFRSSGERSIDTAMEEARRIEFVVQRDGREKAKRWAQRVEHVYRVSVLNPEHFAHSGERRRQFIESYLALKR